MCSSLRDAKNVDADANEAAGRNLAARDPHPFIFIKKSRKMSLKNRINFRQNVLRFFFALCILIWNISILFKRIAKKPSDFRLKYIGNCR